MKGSQKANLIVFLVIAVIAFCISSAFATLTIHDEHDSYKLMALNNDTFEPEDIEYVPTIIPKNDTNTTNTTDTSEDITEDWNDTDDTTEYWNETYDELEEEYEEDW